MDPTEVEVLSLHEAIRTVREEMQRHLLIAPPPEWLLNPTPIPRSPLEAIPMSGLREVYLHWHSAQDSWEDGDDASSMTSEDIGLDLDALSAKLAAAAAEIDEAEAAMRSES